MYSRREAELGPSSQIRFATEHALPSLSVGRFLAAFLIFILAASAGVQAWASSSLAAANGGVDEKQLKSLSLEQLGNIEVTTVNKWPTELWDTPSAVYVITADDIRRSGATSIADALRLAPGVEVGRLSSTTWAVGIRGLQNNFSKSVLVLIDGRNVYTPLFAGVYWDVQDMPLENIDRIEVIRGPGGTIWGPNAANGVIDIITKKAKETRGTMATGLAGTQDHTIDTLQFGFVRGDLSYRFYGRGFQRGHEYHTDGINDDAWHQERFGFRTDLDKGRDSYTLEGMIYGGDSPHIIGTSTVVDQTSGGDVNFRWGRENTDGTGFTLQSFFDRTVRTGIALGETRDTIDIDFVQHLNLPAGQKFAWGGGLHWSPYQIVGVTGFEALIPASATDHNHTGFVQDEIPLPAHVFLTAGAKLQHNNYSGFDIQPSGRLLWTPTEHQSAWVGVTRAVTTPSDLEEDFQLTGPVGPSTFIRVAGNPNFKSEDVIGYEAGYRTLLHDRVFLDLAGFRNQYSRLQSFSAPMLSVTGGDIYITIQYQNQIAGSTTGFEIGPQVALASWWRLNSSYSFLSSNFHANGPTSDISGTGSVSTYEKSSPKHMVTADSKVNLPDKFEFDQVYRFVSALPAQKVEAYQTMDLHLGRVLGKHFRFAVVGQNLFQPHHYEWGTGDPTQPPVGIDRAAYAQLTFFSHPSW
jgi:iron complex outermembrane receptor protein